MQQGFRSGRQVQGDVLEWRNQTWPRDLHWRLQKISQMASSRLVVCQVVAASGILEHTYCSGLKRKGWGMFCSSLKLRDKTYVHVSTCEYMWVHVSTCEYMWVHVLPSGKQPHNYRKSPLSMGKSTISMVIFNGFLYVITRPAISEMSRGSSVLEPACRRKKTGKALDQTMPSTVTERYALMVKPSDPSDFNMAYPLVNSHITMERSTMFNGKINYFYGHFQ